MHPSHHQRTDFARNDLIYRSPPIHGHQGWLLGSRGAGATVWNPADSVRVQLGHTDLIDRGSANSRDGERPKVTPCLRHAGRLSLSIGGRPLFDPVDLLEYSGRLSLADGELRVEGRSAAGGFSYGAIYGSDPAVFRFTYRDELAEPAARELELERLHSRVISNPWRWIHDESAGNAEDGAQATKAELRDGVWLVTYEDDGFQSALALQLEEVDTGRVAADEQAASEVGPFGIRMRLPASASVTLTVRVAVGVAHDGHSAREDALAALERAAAVDTEAWLNRSRTGRAASYASSMIDLPEDRYWEQLWYLGRYHLRASGEGRYPAFFINGPWGWNRDLRAWSRCWFNWNMHGSHLSLPELGEWDLFGPYADWRMRQVDVYREVTQREFELSGIAFQDQQFPDGGTWESETAQSMNKAFLATGALVALHLYRQWRFTRDEGYLRDVVAPYLAGVVRFWHDYLEADENGVLHVPRSNPYEFHSDYSFRDCLTDLELLRSLLPAYAVVAAAAGDGEGLGSWAREAAGRLASTPALPLPAEYVTAQRDEGSRYYDNPFFFGQPYEAGDSVDSIGWSEEVERWTTHTETHMKGIGNYGAFCSSQTAGIFPAENTTSDAAPAWREQTGADQATRAQWERARNALRTIRRYPFDESAPDKSDVAEPKIAWTGHSLELAAFSRLGLTHELRRAVEFFIDRYQMFPQGMWNYHPRQRWFGNHSLPTSATGDQLRIEHDPYVIHFAFEPQGIFGEALTLALLDCAGGIIRLFQAYDRDARFTLPAWDGFTVTAEQFDGTLRPVRVHSRLGGECRIRVPWERVAVRVAASDERGTAGADSGTTAVETGFEDSVVSFGTQVGREYVVADAGDVAAVETTTGHSGTVSSAADIEPGPKTLGRHAVLGMPRRM